MRGRGSLPGPFTACFVTGVRVCVPPRRWALLLLPVVAAGLFGLLARVSDSPAARALAETDDGIFGLSLPLACLVVGDAVVGAEVRAGTFALTWLSPTPFPTIVLARWLAGWGRSRPSCSPPRGSPPRPAPASPRRRPRSRCASWPRRGRTWRCSC